MAERLQRQVAWTGLTGRPIAVDGFNLLTTVEAALAGGIILRGRDGCLRDLASMHGTWHSVTQTEPALDLCCAALSEVRPSACRWHFDRPVSNSGRLSVMVTEAARARGLTWEVVVEDQVDSSLCAGPAIAITADAGILDRTPAWCCAATAIVDGFIPQAWVLDLTA